MSKNAQLTVRVSEKLRQNITKAHQDFCKCHSIDTSFNSFLAHLIEIGLEQDLLKLNDK